VLRYAGKWETLAKLHQLPRGIRGRDAEAN
jgi:hypothetical protein